MLGLRFCARAFSSCGKWGPLFIAVHGPLTIAASLPPVAASGGHSSSWCAGLSLSRPLLLRSTGSRRAGSAIVAHGPRCSAARGILPDQGSNQCPLPWQADSQPLRHQGSPKMFYFLKTIFHQLLFDTPPLFYPHGLFFFNDMIRRGNIA